MMYGRNTVCALPILQEDILQWKKSSEAVEVNDITGEAISSAWKTNGTFQCDDSRYVQIYDLVEKAVEANMVSDTHRLSYA